jgi:hypothetical protein
LEPVLRIHITEADTDPDPSFTLKQTRIRFYTCDAALDTDLAPHQSDGKQRPHWSKDPPRLYFNLYDTQGFHSEPPQLLNFDFDPGPDPDPAVDFDADQCGSMLSIFWKLEKKTFVAVVADYFRHSVAASTW